MLKIICDRCGAEVEESSNRDNWLWYGHKDNYEMIYQKRMDLCNDCVTSLRNWIRHPGIDVLTEVKYEQT